MHVTNLVSIISKYAVTVIPVVLPAVSSRQENTLTHSNSPRNGSRMELSRRSGICPSNGLANNQYAAAMNITVKMKKHNAPGHVSISE